MIIIPAKARQYVFTGVGLSVCVSVCLCVYNWTTTQLGITVLTYS